MERTALFIKPEAVKRHATGEILSIVEQAGFTIAELKMFRFSKEMAERFYAIHRGKAFFADLISFVISSLCVACVLEKENAVADLRKLVGETDPLKSPPGTIRRCYGTDIQRNAVHASDSVENAQKEISILFERNS
jgi:nucleoside-diphosphate kinase